MKGEWRGRIEKICELYSTYPYLNFLVDGVLIYAHAPPQMMPATCQALYQPHSILRSNGAQTLSNTLIQSRVNPLPSFYFSNTILPSAQFPLVPSLSWRHYHHIHHGQLQAPVIASKHSMISIKYAIPQAHTSH